MKHTRALNLFTKAAFALTAIVVTMMPCRAAAQAVLNPGVIKGNIAVIGETVTQATITADWTDPVTGTDYSARTSISGAGNYSLTVNVPGSVTADYTVSVTVRLNGSQSALALPFSLPRSRRSRDRRKFRGGARVHHRNGDADQRLADQPVPHGVRQRRRGFAGQRSWRLASRFPSWRILRCRCSAPPFSPPALPTCPRKPCQWGRARPCPCRGRRHAPAPPGLGRPHGDIRIHRRGAGANRHQRRLRQLRLDDASCRQRKLLVSGSDQRTLHRLRVFVLQQRQHLALFP